MSKHRSNLIPSALALAATTVQVALGQTACGGFPTPALGALLRCTAVGDDVVAIPTGTLYVTADAYGATGQLHPAARRRFPAVTVGAAGTQIYTAQSPTVAAGSGGNASTVAVLDANGDVIEGLIIAGGGGGGGTTFAVTTTNPNGGPSENYDGTLDYPTFWNTAVAASFYTWNYVGFNTFAGANDATQWSTGIAFPPSSDGTIGGTAAPPTATPSPSTTPIRVMLQGPTISPGANGPARSAGAGPADIVYGSVPSVPTSGAWATMLNGRNLNGGGGHGYAGGASAGVVCMTTSASATCHGGGGSGGGWWYNASRAIGSVSSTFSDWSALAYSRMVVASGFVNLTFVGAPVAVSPSATASSSATISTTASLSASASASASRTGTASVSADPTASASVTASGSLSPSVSPSQTLSPSVSPSQTLSSSVSPSETQTSSITASSSSSPVSPSVSSSVTASPSGSASVSQSGSVSPSNSGSASSSLTASASGSVTLSGSASVSRAASASGSGSVSVSSSRTASVSRSPVSPTLTCSASPSASVSGSKTSSASASGSVSPSPSRSGSVSGSVSETASITASASVTASSSASASLSSSNSASPSVAGSPSTSCSLTASPIAPSPFSPSPSPAAVRVAVELTLLGGDLESLAAGSALELRRGLEAAAAEAGAAGAEALITSVKVDAATLPTSQLQYLNNGTISAADLLAAATASGLVVNGTRVSINATDPDFNAAIPLPLAGSRRTQAASGWRDSSDSARALQGQQQPPAGAGTCVPVDIYQPGSVSMPVATVITQLLLPLSYLSSAGGDATAAALLLRARLLQLLGDASAVQATMGSFIRVWTNCTGIAATGNVFAQVGAVVVAPPPGPTPRPGPNSDQTIGIVIGSVAAAALLFGLAVCWHARLSAGAWLARCCCCCCCPCCACCGRRRRSKEEEDEEERRRLERLQMRAAAEAAVARMLKEGPYRPGGGFRSAVSAVRATGEKGLAYEGYDDGIRHPIARVDTVLPDIATHHHAATGLPAFGTAGSSPTSAAVGRGHAASAGGAPEDIAVIVPSSTASDTAPAILGAVSGVVAASHRAPSSESSSTGKSTG